MRASAVRIRTLLLFSRQRELACFKFLYRLLLKVLQRLALRGKQAIPYYFD